MEIFYIFLLQGNKHIWNRISGQIEQTLEICCAICLDVLRDPATIPCGHSYCMDCIRLHWDKEDEKGFFAGAEDVACDYCSGRKLKAVKSCLKCLVSFCEQHLQPHHQVAALKTHKLVNPSKNIEENICPHHKEVMTIFCRSDQECICSLCFFDQHKEHEVVSAEGERMEKQKELKPSCDRIQEQIQERGEDMMILLKEIKAINLSADKAEEDSEKIFNELIHLIKEKQSDTREQIRSQQTAEVNRVKDFLLKLKDEITELKWKSTKLEQLSGNQDHNQFLRLFPLLSEISESTQLSRPKPRPLRYFDNFTTAVSSASSTLQSVFSEEWPKISQTLNEVEVLLPRAEPQTRAEFLQFFSQISLDPNSVNKQLILSDGNRRATYVSRRQTYPSHPDRFMSRSQVLSAEGLTGRHYWEVEWSDFGIYVAVAYQSISRKGDDSEFGNNDRSWALLCSYGDYQFFHDKTCQSFLSPWTSRVGVYLDHQEGILSFYRVSVSTPECTMTLLHRVQTTFSEPLHAGLRAYYFQGSGSTAELCQLN
uniref:Tripartite motif-containing protein 16-like n=1 Tax=Salarias fasciatus TaxID=181472 RepID=A0A672FNK6_SALFA